MKSVVSLMFVAALLLAEPVLAMMPAGPLSTPKADVVTVAGDAALGGITGRMVDVA